MATLDEVLNQLRDEEVPTEIDFNAPEPGAFPPAFAPSTHPFTFRLVEDATKQFEVVEIEGRKYLQVNFVAEVEHEGTTRKVMFQKANTYKTDKMDNSSIGNLIRSLELRDAYEEARSATGDANEAFVQTLQAADGRAVGLAAFGWSAAFKDALVVYRTAASKKRPAKKSGGYTTLPWPRDREGKFLPTVPDPQGGSEKYGNLEITTFKIAKPTPVTA